MSDKTLENVKKIITGIMVSMADEPFVTQKKLTQKYREFEGSPIPYFELGFKQIEDFFRSIPDVLKVSYSHRDGIILEYNNPANSKSKHIAELVSQQNNKKRIKSRPSRNISSAKSFNYRNDHRFSSSSRNVSPPRTMANRNDSYKAPLQQLNLIRTNNLSNGNMSSNRTMNNSIDSCNAPLQSSQQQQGNLRQNTSSNLASLFDLPKPQPNQFFQHQPYTSNYSPINQPPLISQYPPSFSSFPQRPQPSSNRIKYNYDMHQYQIAVDQYYRNVQQINLMNSWQGNYNVQQQRSFQPQLNMTQITNDIRNRVQNIQLNEMPQPQFSHAHQQQPQQPQSHQIINNSATLSNRQQSPTENSTIKPQSNHLLDTNVIHSDKKLSDNDGDNSQIIQSVVLDDCSNNDFQSVTRDQNDTPNIDYGLESVVSERILEQSEVISNGIYSDIDSIPSINEFDVSVVKQCELISDDSIIDDAAEAIQDDNVLTKIDRNASNNELVDDQCEALSECSDAIPDLLDTDPIFLIDLPNGCVGVGATIPPAPFPDYVKEGEYIKVFIAEVNSPYKFWFHFFSEANKLDNFMDEINIVYSRMDTTEFQINPVNCIEGLLCMALYDNRWHRGEILNIKKNRVKIFFIDYGTVSETNVKDIKYMLEIFTKLPTQAFRGSLDFIRPIGIRWSLDATYSMLACVNNKLLYAKATEINFEDRHMYMVLTNTNGPTDVQINELLITRGFAKYYDTFLDNDDGKKKPSGSKSKRHIQENYPTFPMLERGIFPSFSEVSALVSKGFDFDALQDEMIFYNANQNLNKKLLPTKINVKQICVNSENNTINKQYESSLKKIEHESLTLSDEQNFMNNINNDNVSLPSSSTLKSFKPFKINSNKLKKQPESIDQLRSSKRPPPGFKKKIK